MGLLEDVMTMVLLWHHVYFKLLRKWRVLYECEAICGCVHERTEHDIFSINARYDRECRSIRECLYNHNKVDFH